MAQDGSRAQYYRERGRQVRAIAIRTRDADVKYEYEQIAMQYERLAAQVETEGVSS